MDKSIHRDLEKLGMALRLRRTAAHLSQEGLAEKANLSGKFISEIENAKKAATAETLLKLSRALRVPLSSILLDAGL